MWNTIICLFSQSAIVEWNSCFSAKGLLLFHLQFAKEGRRDSNIRGERDEEENWEKKTKENQRKKEIRFRPIFAFSAEPTTVWRKLLPNEIDAYKKGRVCWCLFIATWRCYHSFFLSSFCNSSMRKIQIKLFLKHYFVCLNCSAGEYESLWCNNVQFKVNNTKVYLVWFL